MFLAARKHTPEFVQKLEKVRKSSISSSVPKMSELNEDIKIEPIPKID